MIYHPDGFTIADYSSIEARMVQFMAEDQDALDVYRQGLDPYKWMAAKIYGVTYEQVTDKERFTGKQAVLGLGYQMSAKKFIMMVEGYGETISKQEATKAVDTYRKTYKKVADLWRRMNLGCVKSVLNPGLTIRVNQYVSFITEGDFLRMNLPSGRQLSYYKPEPEYKSMGTTVSYMSMNSQHQYVRTHTYGGKLTENLVQAAARDVLVHAVHSLMEDYTVVTHIHDEVVLLGRHDLETIGNIMCDMPEWCDGLPLAVDGFTSGRYKK